MAEQLALTLPVRPALGREDFFVSASNALALASLDGWQSWPLAKLVLVGPPGAGKTHLAQVWAHEHGAVIVQATELGGADIAALAGRGFVVVENAHLLAEPAGGHPAAEQALFHLHNLTLAEGGRLLITATTPPAHWGLSLPDLASRMAGTTIARLDPPDDALLAAMLLKLFADRQIAVPPQLIPYLVKRMERSHAAAATLVAALDEAALARGGPVSLSMAAAMLDNHENSTEY
ncbi:MAG: chromosomal replication initiator DnaA [Paracoccaceae bacterium]